MRLAVEEDAAATVAARGAGSVERRAARRARETSGHRKAEAAAAIGGEQARVVVCGARGVGDPATTLRQDATRSRRAHRAGRLGAAIGVAGADLAFGSA